MGYQLKLIKNDEPTFGHLRFKTVLTGIAITALGLYYQAEQSGMLPMYISADWMSKISVLAGVLVWYFRVQGFKTDSSGRLSADDIQKIKDQAREEAMKELQAPDQAAQ